ncbi:MAG: 16S rRNA (cytidine(1402)-2'-O)-methyltransferase [Myxococcales bacterium]|nr:16S rRNA (cytidine(1402)-2'-O)-methyltransferase [Myxococcales bacterium]
MSRLSIIPTPIGNLKDITLRALETLRIVDLLCAEDSRHTAALLTAHGISAKEILSLNEHNEHTRIETVIERIRSGQHVGLVSDAGTPLISDPGFALVRQAIAYGVVVEPIPGPNAAITALIASGLPPEPFHFIGFAPKKPGKLTRWLHERVRYSGTYIAYVPGRDAQLFVNAVAGVWPDAHVVVAREMTKVYETFHRGLASQMCIAPTALRGEATVVFNLTTRNDSPGTEEIQNDLRALLAGGLSRRDAAIATAYFRKESINLVKSLTNALQTDT